jgi:hypothetical protein
MGKRIVPYPTLGSKEALSKLGAIVSWGLFDGTRDLEYENISGCQYRISDKTWYPDTSALSVRFQVDMKNPKKLFEGVRDNEGCEIADRASNIGVALRWRLPKTNLQGAVHCTDITFHAGGSVRFQGGIDFPSKVIRFSLVLEVILYLRESNVRKLGIYAKKEGSVLGVVDRFVLATGGSGGYFPTVTEKLEGDPAWKVFANITCAEDFDEDFSSDYFHLSLNEAHPLYEKFYVTSRNGVLFVSPLMFEAFVNACCILISRASKFIKERSWTLTPDEKDEQTIYVNFKSLLLSCLPSCSKKEICNMELEDLFYNVRAGLSKHMRIDSEEQK